MGASARVLDQLFRGRFYFLEKRDPPACMHINSPGTIISLAVVLTLHGPTEP